MPQTEKNNISVVKTKYDDSSFNKFKNKRAQYVEVRRVKFKGNSFYSSYSYAMGQL